MDETVYIPFLILSLWNLLGHTYTTFQFGPATSPTLTGHMWPRLQCGQLGASHQCPGKSPCGHTVWGCLLDPLAPVRYWPFLLDSCLDSPPVLPVHSLDPWTPSFDLPHLLPGPLTHAELQPPRTNEGRARLWPLPGQLHLTELSMMMESPTSVMSTIGA